MNQFIDAYGHLLHQIAEIVIYSLELIGILIIVIGTLRALSLHLIRVKNREPINIVQSLGRSLALALEFKMGAEIVKTVIVHELSELLVLTVVILIRALLAFIIHWEMHVESDHSTKNKKKEDTDK